MDADFGDISSYWNILRRRKMAFFLPFFTFLAIGTAFAFLLPPTFRSQATIQIERKLIDIEGPTVVSFVQEQIEQIRQRITTYDEMLALAKAQNIYPELVGKDPAEAVSSVKRGIKVEMLNVNASSADQRGERKATIGFTVGFEYREAKAAQQVANEIAQRYLDEHQSMRGDQDRETKEFFGREAEALRLELETMDQELADFRQKNFRDLPELINMNLKLYEQTEADIKQSETRIRQLEDSLFASQSELSLTSPYNQVTTESGRALQSASERLSSLTVEYMRLSTRYSAKHPAVIAIQREIRMLADETGSSARADEVLTQLAQQQEKLRQARRQYDDGHPEVRSLESSVAALQRGLQTAIVSNDSGALPELPPDNPRYVGLQNIIRTTESNIAAERSNLAALREKLVEYQGRIERNPEVEAQLKELTRDYEATRKQYRELTEQRRAAEINEQLEQAGSGERFELVSRAAVPSLPDSPNRIAILVLGMFFATFAGLIAAAIAEYLDRTIRGVRTVVSTLGEPPLVIIPQIPKPGTASRADGAVL